MTRKWKKAKSIIRSPNKTEIENWRAYRPIQAQDKQYEYKIIDEAQCGYHLSNYTLDGWQVVKVIAKKREIIDYEYILKREVR